MTTNNFAADLAPLRPGAGAAPASGSGLRTWLWLAVAVALLAGSGRVRAWQDRRFEAARDRVVTPVFPLKDLPTGFGAWKVVEGGEASLDPQIARIAGSVDSVLRSYVDETTGVVVTVLVIYGRAEAVTLHTPELCYPASGYNRVDDAYDVLIPVAGGAPPRFRSLIYKKEGGASANREEVYYSFLQDDRWSPDLAGNWRTLRYSPPVFKVQTRRLITDRENRHVNNPAEQFLAAFVREMNDRVASAQAAGGGGGSG